MIVEELLIGRDELAEASGWKIEDYGACRGDVCVPLGSEVRTADGRVDLTTLAPRLEMPIVHEPEAGVYAVGPASLSGRALVTAQAPDLTLPDVDGRPFSLSSLRGRKVCLVAWSPY